ncbi:hypothetical protein Ddc_24946 [Ditylenchus destructor]|nr:hypothetical protein Ddc_24946 [Ditylenchus destructor]
MTREPRINGKDARTKLSFFSGRLERTLKRNERLSSAEKRECGGETIFILFDAKLEPEYRPHLQECNVGEKTDPKAFEARCKFFRNCDGECWEESDESDSEVSEEESDDDVFNEDFIQETAATVNKEDPYSAEDVDEFLNIQNTQLEKLKLENYDEYLNRYLEDENEDE